MLPRTASLVHYCNLFIYDCVAIFCGFKFADDTTVIRLITNNDEAAYRDEVANLSVWCNNNNLFLNVAKTKELIIDFSRFNSILSPVCIDNAAVEIVNSFKFLGILITDSLCWSLNVSMLIKKAQQRLFFLRCLKKYELSTNSLTNFYRSTIGSILTGSILVWFGNITAQDHKLIKRTIKTASRIIGSPLPQVTDIYTT